MTKKETTKEEMFKCVQDSAACTLGNSSAFDLTENEEEVLANILDLMASIYHDEEMCPCCEIHKDNA